MKLDLSLVVNSLRGKAMRTNEIDGGGKDITLGDALDVCVKINAEKEDPSITMMRYNILKKISKCEIEAKNIIDLTVEEGAFVKNMVKSFSWRWNAEMIGRVCDMIEGEAVVKEDQTK